MVDFIEYVVAELKSKRLSKTNAAALVRQFSRRSSIPAPASVIHPLLHCNTSDLSAQRYCSTFAGDEFFLVDHQLKTTGHAGQKVLPGVAYLEMARAAIEQALPAKPESTLLELHDTVWAQPIVVALDKQVSIVLVANDNDDVDYEICSEDAERQIVHCQGRAVFSHQPAPARLDLDQIEGRMGQGQLEPDAVYATCARMGLVYGPAFRGITLIKRGNAELLVQLRLPNVVAESAGDYVLHPSLMDGALQAAVGLMESGSDASRPRVPFALELLRIVSPCVQEMVAWVRYAAGCKATDNVVKLDFDLCDALGNICVQMHGFSSRILTQEIDTETREMAARSLLAIPVWETSGAETTAGVSEAEYAEHHVILCELAKIEIEKLTAPLPQGRFLSLQSSKETIAQRYTAHAVACFERIKDILQSKPQGMVLVQIVVPGHEEQALLAGLSGLLKTAALENPRVVGQLILVPADATAEELGGQLQAEKLHALDSLIRYEAGGRQVLRWREVSAKEEKPPVSFREDGVYLITGGLGGLGVLFAKEILAQTGQSIVVLTGRSAWSAETQVRLDELAPQAGRLSYRQVDLGDPDQVRQLVATIRDEYGQLSGILHSAGMIADSFLLKKSSAEFREVLAPKVTGTFNLDQASQDVELDFFVLFSAIAGALGNPGQGDYAAANSFMDQLAAYRNRQVAAKQRHGRTLSIDWPLWRAGGMGIDPASQELLQQTIGMRPMQTATGMDAFHRSLALACDHILVVEGDLTQIRRALLGAPGPATDLRAEHTAVVWIDPESLTEKTQEYLRRQLSGLLKLPAHEIDPRAALENYGIDSILAMKLTSQLEKTFGSLSRTLFFEYQTIRELTEYFVTQHVTQLTTILALAGSRPTEINPSTALAVPPAPTKLVSSRRFSRPYRGVSGSTTDVDPIAIIGLSGRYPESPDIEAYWENLRDGKDCITEVPRERWDWREYFSEDRSKSGHHYSKWGGFIAGVDEFDPLFFNISPADAEYIDPQERLFLQHAWMAMEDAGYTRAGLQVPYAQDLPGQVGVYVGVMYTEYQLFGAEATAQGRRLGIVGSAASISNRVSYALNLHGPSMTLDTMCSSSLTAIHIACQDLKQGRTSLAIAGGVNVTIHPNKYLVLSAGQFISGDGHCQSFGEGGDGYIPGEGVGAVVLKRLSEAKRDGDHIYGIIRGSALTHGGKTNGYSVPNPQAQTSAVGRALSESRIDPRHISYIEAHGTGTKLGDPIEIAALSKAFHQYTQDTEFCRIGSAKSNIGHTESAAGIAGLTKVLLQMQHQQIVPSLHSAQLNPHIDFPKSPFIVNQSTTTWEQPVIDGRKLPRIAGISSFGAGGSNAHMLVEEYQPPVRQPKAFASVVILLTAKAPEQLRQKALDLLAFMQPRLDTIDLVDMAYTLQVGREAMEQRLGLIVSSVDQLAEKLRAWVAGEQGIEDVHQGQVKRNNETLSLFSDDADLQQTVDKWVAGRRFSKLLDLWIKGLDVDWSTLYGKTKPSRVSLPTYPFAREHYWIDIAAGAPLAAREAATVVLHPLLHSNTSDFSQQRYSSTFTGEEFFLADHQVTANGDTGQKVLPGVVYLEMARAAIVQSLSARSESTSVELLNIVWAQPIVISVKRQVSITLVPNDNEIDYEIYTDDGESAIVHCQGRAIVGHAAAPAPLDLAQIETEMGEGVWEPARVYAACARLGLVYGPSFQGITAVHQGSHQLLAHLRLPAALEATAAAFVLHPSLMDGALQAAVGLLGDSLAQSSQARLPFALDTLRVVSPCTAEMVAWLRYAPGSRAEDPVVKLDIDLCDERGNICVQMRGFSSRLVGTALRPAAGALLATSVREARDLSESGQADDAEQHVEPRADLAAAAPGIDTESLAEKTQDYLRRQFSGLLKMPFHKIDPHAALEQYGIDSILAMKLTSALEKTFGSLSKTLFFEYQTIRELAKYFVAGHAALLTALLAPEAKGDETGLATAQLKVPASTKRIQSRRFSHMGSASSGATTEADPIAIIGLSGRYPEAPDLEAYWENLREGKDCITEVPKDRWDWREYFSDDRTKGGHHLSKWGGFISGVDEFDPLFFNMSPLEAELVDPQERVFLQHAWMAMEDAGYTRASLQVPEEHDLAGQVGVYVGVMYSEYQLFGAEASLLGKRLGVPGSPASIANRVSYALNLHGPSMTLDTMCSSSLTAIHVACLELKLGRTSLAIAGGVNVTIHPNKYLVLSAGQFISSDGHCQSFGEGGDGYIPGEGVGVVVLKRLSEAKRDGDHIYGVIRGSALNHGGKTNGYTVPNPQAQTGAIRRALAESKTDPRHISYVEAHGTGTILGDPIEIAALSKAFHDQTQDAGFCLIGSAKSNIGHCESAAGIAGLTKVLLQMQHQQIVPSLHSTQLNPHIDFDATPFTVNQTLRPWEQPVIDGRTLPRIAGISSFGAGGSNAHMIVEEYQQPARTPISFAKVVILLSAKTPEQLRQRASDLLEFVQPRLENIDLAAVAFTLQVGREAMEERLGFVVSSAEHLVDSLRAWLAGEQQIEDAYQGQVIRSNVALSLFSTDVDLKQAMDKWIANRKLSKLLELWTYGMDLDWSGLYGEERPSRVSLPTYPFAKERYWIDTAASGPVAARGAATALLHPLLHSNTSDLSEQRYSSTFTGAEFFLADHQVAANGHGAQKVLPGVAQLEMARAAVEHASPFDSESTGVELRNVVWAEPVIVAGSKQVSIALAANGHDEIDYEIYSQEAEREIVHGQGRAILGRRAAPAPIDLEQLRGEMHQGTLEPTGVYAACARMGLLYGSSFQGITAIHRGSDQLLAELRLPKSVEETSGDYVLHPSLMDSAVHACVGLIDVSSEGAGQPRVPFALDSLRMVSPCTSEMVAWVRYAPGTQAGNSVVKLDIDLCDERGNVCVQMHGLSSRAMNKEISKPAAAEQSLGSLLAIPVWQTSRVEASAERDFAEHHVIVCELSEVDAETLESAVPGGRCLLLQAEPQKTIAERYGDFAVACFDRIQTILRSKPRGKLLVHIAVPDHQEQALFAGVSGLLKTAALENPQFIGQLLLVPACVTAVELALYVRDEKVLGLEPIVRYENGARQVVRWLEVAGDCGDSTVAFKNDGVYLLTGGLGGLGVLFAKEILERTGDARVVLTGRSELTTEKQILLDGLPSQPGRVSYRKLDLGDPEEVRQVIAAIAEEYHQLSGILHSAGMIADHFILKKSAAEFSRVLAPKVTGTFNLDQASQDIELDFFVLFSSVAGALGNPGQADYAAANGFMDQFAAYRNRQVAAGLRRGRTLSINWPMWQAGGMAIDPAGQELMQQTTGMQPMQTATGMQAFYRSLSLPYDQVLVAEGDLAQMRRALAAGRPIPPQPSPRLTAVAPIVRPETAAAGIGSGSLAEKTQEYLRRQFADLLKLPAHKIDPGAALEKYGIDSVLAMRLTNQLETTFGSLSKTLFYEYQTIVGLAAYFVKAYPAIVREAVGFMEQKPAGGIADAAVIDNKRPAPGRRGKGRLASQRTAHSQEIAIVGLAGRYPQAENLQEFWRNLQNGRDSITEVPSERWDHSLYFDPDPNKAGKSYSKWGGFIDDVDKFDPRFFNISPKEAAMIDPQERLFLETAWQTIEDAGYTKESISGGRVGVYVGVMWGQYQLFGAESILKGNTVLASSSYASVANRVSYFFDFRGPSIALDTMCSSSLTAIHLACDSLRKGEIDAAIAGGVNVSIHPYKYLSLSQGKFVASDGRCRSFGAGGDGYVPGEGVGAVLLKPLEHALRDRDQIYAVIKASAINHGGKTNGYTVPNPNAQGDVIAGALRTADIDPRTLSYIETHGTGTSLGDPIEITGLLKAFESSSEDKQFCAIGSVKSNIGHLESAAGIAAVTKALLQIKHGQLVPSLHADPPNPNINFEGSPFYVQTELAEWKRTSAHPRRAGVSSFGAGGSNAHLILEEYAEVREEESASHAAPPPEAFVLSARTPDALRRYAERIVHFLGDVSGVSLADIAYTSQVGRTPMDARLVIIASSVEDLIGKLNEWIAAGNASGLDAVFYANIREAQVGAGSLIAGPEGTSFLEALLGNGDLEKIASLWVLGADVDWSLLWRHATPRRVSLPTYPFAKERHWIDQEASALRVVQASAPNAARAATIERAGEKRQPLKDHDVNAASLLARTEAYLKALIGEEIKLAPDRIGSSDPLESFGLESIVINRITAQLEHDLGELPKTMLYEHETVRDLARFLVKETAEALTGLFGSAEPADEPALPAKGIEEDAVQVEVSRTAQGDGLEPIAIIGIHGLYPHSASLAEYWENLKQGKDLIDLVPANRWDYEEFYHPDPAAAADGKIYCKWGGFLDDHDKFDPHFFKIPTAEAGLIDPQERMFLESVWAAVEDAGYTRDGLRSHHPKSGSADVGVFVGVTTNSYHLWAPEERNRGHFVSPTAFPWSIANRVSYFFDFNGPSLPIDTACSSSLVAIHLACESLRKLDCQVAVAGGVNLYLHPEKYHSLCQRRMLSLDGKCHSYGAGDDGFVPGEGVGTLVLKRLSKAVEDQDRVYAVIRASAFDHSGRSNGYSAPNPNAQANLISHTLGKAGIHPETIGYVEGHGTGTQLGDSIEIAALTKAFQKETTKKQFCPIGSVKANIGHSESAAGVAGVAKVILQMEHGQLAPSIYSNAVNPNIEFEESPFYLQHGLSEWESSPDHPRRALVNSFGAGGVNACVVIEEYAKPASSLDAHDSGPWLFTLSARNEDRLREYADLLLARLQSTQPIDLPSLCYTLQAGREAMEERLAIVVSDTSELIDRLGGWSKRESAAGIHRGSPGPRRGTRRSLKLAKTGTGEQSLIELATKWVAGEDVEWESLYSPAKPRRIGVPTYPFARERYWFSDSPVPERPVLSVAHLHPLIAYNSSTLKEVNFSSSLPDTAFYAVDHRVHDERIFPGAAFLEMACIAANMAGEGRVRKITDIVWMRPLSFRTGSQALRTALRRVGDSVEYVISSLDEENEQIVHSEGRLVFGHGPADAADAEDRVPLSALKESCAKPNAGAACYERFSALGLHYGPSFQTIQELYASPTFALAKLKIPDHLKGEFGQFILHPSMIDGALQTMAGMVGGPAPQTLCLPFALDEIEIMRPVPQTCYAYVEHADALAQHDGGVTKVSIRLLNESGETLIRLRNLYVKPLAIHSFVAAQSAPQGRVVSLSGGGFE